MPTSGAVQPGLFGATLYSYPASGTFAADRTPVLGNTSGAAGLIGPDFDGLLTSVEPQNSTRQPIVGDGFDYTRTRYPSNTVTVPVLVFADTAHAALVEWRRIVAGFDARYKRAALEVWDPNTTGQESRWLSNLIYRAATQTLLEHADKDVYEGRIQFETIGAPFWTPEPIAANEVTVRLVPTGGGTIDQVFLTNPGDVGAWPRIDMNALPNGATVSVVLASTLDQVDIVDLPFNGTYTIDFDRRNRPLDAGRKVSPGSKYFQIPPSGTFRLDIFATGTPAGNTWIDVSFLPQYSTV